MATRAEVEKLALDLPETERAALAAHLLGSLQSVLHDEDEGIAEALRRDAGLEANPSLGMTLEAFRVPRIARQRMLPPPEYPRIPIGIELQNLLK